ncbi:hypothetical protein E5K00_21600 [Hymenobacter aquaticus]|uniref:Uncharacterized protein n=1 Tax=Hymenobacter aquaticus TaxID=1867101 RepID=A0A4Z0PUM4_9BACT|nr:hypothetical protein [Hymenobacter aquaticus]TGE20593.1 hypothetical protein E5K00_21600 [Hymenobacter aquaticus]
MAWHTRAAVLILSLGAFLLTSCSAVPEKVVQIGFEDIDGWVRTPPAWLTDSTAHSGRWSGQLLATADFGPGFSRTWQDLNNPKTIRVGSWVWLPHGRVHTALAIEIKRGEESLYYQNLGLQDVVKRYDQWELVHQTHELPADMQPSDVIKVYVWQWGGHYTIKYDDMFVEKLR